MDFGEIDRVMAAHRPARVVERIAPFLTDARKARIEQVLSGRLESIRVAVEHPEDPHNAAAIVRSAEAFGVLHVHVVDAPEGALHAASTTQGAYHWVHTYHHDRLDQLLSSQRAAGARVAGALMEGSFRVDELPVDRPLCVLFGNEGEGLSQDALHACDLTFRIPMFGMSESLNLSVSAAITLYQTTSARRRRLGRTGDLEGERLELERARYYARSIEARLFEELMARG